MTTGSFEHELDEAYYMTAAPRAVKGYAFWAYNCDDYIGVYLDYDSEEQEGQAQISENYLTVVRYAIEEGAAVAEVNPINEVSIYPNPANANGGININSAMATEAQINFHNIAGQLVKTVNKDLTAGVNTIAINDLNSVVYFCTINANGYNKTVKLVVK